MDLDLPNGPLRGDDWVQGATCQPRKFTSIEDIFSPILHLKQHLDRDQLGERRTREALLRASKIVPMLLHRKKRANVPCVCDGQAMLARDSTHGPWETA
jgi:hypothetical protein